MQYLTSSVGLKAIVPLLLMSVAGCVVPPQREAARVSEETVEPIRDVYVYPNKGQSEAQTDRDRYECHTWAVGQTHFDPSTAPSDEVPHVRVVSAPQGAGTAAGAVTGAVIGAAISRPRDAPGGALFGAVAGALIGAAADQQRQEQVDQAQRVYDRDYAARVRPAREYRRALSACLEGRGYTIK